MASLLDWLAYSGARKTDGTPVASGRAFFYVPGSTSQSASVYSDKDGLIALATPVTLDASGRAEVYIKTPVHVEVFDAAGNLVRLEDRVGTVNAAQVEIEHPIATGIDLTTGQIIAGGRTDLNTFLSNLLVSLGTTDGKVLVGGAGQNIKDLLSGTTAIWFSVQNTAYSGGAKGNDSTDDTAAIQATINAANTAGGGIVYFPPGTYKVTSPITIPSGKIWILGVDPTGSIIKTYSSGSIFAASGGCSFWNMGFAQDSATGGTMFSGGIATARFINCNFTASANSTTLIAINGGPTTTSFSNCAFTISATSGTLFSLSAATISLSLVNCTIAQNTATAVPFSVGAAGTLALTVQMIGGSITIPTATSTFTVSPTTTTAPGTFQFTGVNINHTAAAGTTTFVGQSTGLNVSLSGCALLCGGGATFQLTNSGAGNAPTVYELGNLITAPTSTAITLGAATVVSLSRQVNGIRTSSSATSYAPDASRAVFHDVSSSGASFQFAAPTNTPSTPTFGTAPFQMLILRYKNLTAGAITPTFAAIYKIGTAPSVGASQAAVWIFMLDTIGNVYLQVGGNPVAYAA